MNIKNADMPAMPLTGDAYTDLSNYDGTRNTSCNPECLGLTKREHAAIEIMAGMAASNHGYHDYKYMASDAVKQADALLAELEQSK